MRLLPALILLFLIDVKWVYGGARIQLTLDSSTDTSANMSAALDMQFRAEFTLEVVNYDCIDEVGGTTVACFGTVIETSPGRVGPSSTPATIYWSNLMPGAKYGFRVNNLRVGATNRTSDRAGEVEFCTPGQLPPAGMTLTEGVGSSVNVSLQDPTSGTSGGFKITYSVWDTTNSNWTLRGDRNLTTTAGTFANEVDINLTPVGSLYRIVAEAVDLCGDGLSEDNITEFFESRIPDASLTLAFAGNKLVCVLYSSSPRISWTRLNLLKNGTEIGSGFHQPYLTFACAEVDDPDFIGPDDTVEVQFIYGTNLTVEGVEYSLQSNIVTETYNLTSTMLIMDPNITCANGQCDITVNLGNDVANTKVTINITYGECGSLDNLVQVNFIEICSPNLGFWNCFHSLNGLDTDTGLSFQIDTYWDELKWAELIVNIGDCPGPGSGSESESGTEILRGFIGTNSLVAFLLPWLLIATLE